MQRFSSTELENVGAVCILIHSATIYQRVANWTLVGYKKVEDLEGECEQLMKKAIIGKLRGDEKLAEEWAQNHNRVWEGAQKMAAGEIK